MSLLSQPDAASVLVVDDSAFTRLTLKRMIESDPRLHVVGDAQNGRDALDKIRSLQPDVVTLDVEMPGWNGLETLKRIARECPRPVIMVSSHTREGAETSLEALEVGAFDYVAKRGSRTQQDRDGFRFELLAKLRAAADTVHRPRVSTGVSATAPQAQSAPTRGTRPEIVAIGCSTGGPKALQTILPQLPASFPVPILIVQHMPVGFTGPFAERLNRSCALNVHEAVDGQPVEAGNVYIARAGYHMELSARGKGFAVQLVLPTSLNSLHVPSVDIMMTSVANNIRGKCLGVILTGMGQDGLLGMKAISKAGGVTLGQDEDSCAVYGMPRSCAEAGILQRIVPLSGIPQQLTSAVTGNWR